MLLELENVDAGYGATVVVRNLSLCVDAGEMVALLGPNGAGKTTTLSTAFGILRPMAGAIRFCGEPTDVRTPHKNARRGLTYVPEGRELFTGLTVNENLRLGSQPGPIKLGTVLDLFPALARLRGRRAGLLSGGEQQMLAIGRALVGNPQVLMVDELSLGLAPLVVREALGVLRDLADRTGLGVLLVEQHVDLALEYSDRTHVLIHGDSVLSDTSAAMRADRGLLERAYLGQITVPDAVPHNKNGTKGE